MLKGGTGLANVGVKLFIPLFPGPEETSSTSRTVSQGRIQQLTTEISSCQAHSTEPGFRLSAHEKFSPTSGFNRILREYTFTSQEEKLPLLKNALLNALFLPYTESQREQCFQLLETLRFLDIQILCYLMKCHREAIQQKEAIEVSDSQIGEALDMTVNALGVRRALDRLRTEGLLCSWSFDAEEEALRADRPNTMLVKLFLSFLRPPRQLVL